MGSKGPWKLAQVLHRLCPGNCCLCFSQVPQQGRWLAPQGLASPLWASGSALWVSGASTEDVVLLTLDLKRARLSVTVTIVSLPAPHFLLHLRIRLAQRPDHHYHH